VDVLVDSNNLQDLGIERLC